MVAWQRAEVPESTPTITPRKSSAWTPSKRFLWFDHKKHGMDRSRQCFDDQSDGSCATCRGRERVSGKWFGKHSIILSTVHNVMQHTYTRMLQLLKWPSLLTPYKAHSRNAEVRISEAILQGDTVNVTFWSSPHFLHCNFLDNSITYFPMTGPNPNYMFTQPTWNSGFDECVFSF